MTIELAKEELQHKAVNSLVLRGDISALSPSDRTVYYLELCRSLGLNPATQPLAVLKLNGKDIFYPTRGATDQLAALHKINREIIDGPKVVEISKNQIVYALCKATHPNGRVETAVATLYLKDPAMDFMKCETKAKRRATISILGFGMLDESELEDIPDNQKQQVEQVFTEEQDSNEDTSEDLEDLRERYARVYLEQLKRAARKIADIEDANERAAAFPALSKQFDSSQDLICTVNATVFLDGAYKCETHEELVSHYAKNKHLVSEDAFSKKRKDVHSWVWGETIALYAKLSGVTGDVKKDFLDAVAAWKPPQEKPPFDPNKELSEVLKDWKAYLETLLHIEHFKNGVSKWIKTANKDHLDKMKELCRERALALCEGNEAAAKTLLSDTAKRMK